MEEHTVVISFGGSLVAPEEVDTDFISNFLQVVRQYKGDNPDARFVLVVGGGAPARKYQGAARALVSDVTNDDLDWIGVMATRLNAELIRVALGELCIDPVVYNPSEPVQFNGDVLVGCGWKPGFSSDYDAVLLAEQLGATKLINLSNISHVYSDDPKVNPHAVPLSQLSWKDFAAMIGDEWKPGANLPFDPVATKKAMELGLHIYVARGTDMENLVKILRNDDFTGTVIS